MSSFSVSYLVAFGGGIASFSSPCVLPLVPAYLAVVGGLETSKAVAIPYGSSFSDIDGSTNNSTRPEGDQMPQRTPATTTPRASVIFFTLLFICGFSSVFILLGLSASVAGRTLAQHQGVLTRGSGVLMVAMGLFLIASLGSSSPGIYSEYRFHPKLARLGPFAAPVAGAAFAFGWTPCVGPVLAAVLSIAAEQGQVLHGGFLLFVYSAGIGLPFLIAAIAFEQVRGIFTWVRHHSSIITVISSASLLFLGVLLVLDRLSWITTIFQKIT